MLTISAMSQSQSSNWWYDFCTSLYKLQEETQKKLDKCIREEWFCKKEEDANKDRNIAIFKCSIERDSQL